MATCQHGVVKIKAERGDTGHAAAKWQGRSVTITRTERPSYEDREEAEGGGEGGEGGIKGRSG